MGMIFELEESDFAGYIEDGSIYTAQLVQTTLKEVTFPSDPNPQKRIGWKFRIESDDAHDGRDIWGETSVKFSKHPDCRLYSWSEALLGQELPAGYHLDLDTLLDRRCRVIIEKKEYTDKKTGEPKTINKVREVHPSRETLASMNNEEDF